MSFEPKTRIILSSEYLSLNIETDSEDVIPHPQDPVRDIIRNYWKQDSDRLVKSGIDFGSDSNRIYLDEERNFYTRITEHLEAVKIYEYKLIANDEVITLMQPDLEDNWITSLFEGAAAADPQQPILNEIFLDPALSTRDDLTTDPDKRPYALEQINKYKSLLPTLQLGSFYDFTTNLYVYEPDDGDNIVTDVSTNFFNRQYEQNLKNKNPTSYPAYFQENISVDRTLSSIPEPSPSAPTSLIDRNNFYSNWDFTSEVKKNIFFSDIPNTHASPEWHFPRHMKKEIKIETTPRYFIDHSPNYIEDNPATSFNVLYDKICAKYINKITTLTNDQQLILSSGENLDSVSSYLFPFESLFKIEDDTLVDEQVVSPELTHVLSTTNMLRWADDFTFTDEEKQEIKDRLTGPPHGHFNKTNWESYADCILYKAPSRKYSEILNGTNAHSEPLLYEVEKFDSKGEKINSFFYPARLFTLSDSSGYTLFNFIDTQLRYDEEYSYTLKVHQLVYGTKYRFESYSAEELEELLDAEKATVDFYNVKKVKLDFELRILPIVVAEWSTSFQSRPALPPAVTLIPQKNNSGMPKFFLETSYGAENVENPTESYKPMSTQELSLFNNILNKYTTEQNEETILHAKTEHQSKNYEIFRISHPPKSFSDFENSLIATVSPLHADTSEYSPAAIFEDNIRPNKKYYYMFRSLDVWGTPSLPSGPFEYEISKDAKSFISRYNFYNMNPVIPKQNLKMKKMIKITPSWKNILFPDMSEIDNASSAFEMIPEPPEDGVPPSSIELKNKIRQKMIDGSVFWNKTYKIRVTSKKTGRKIDIIFKPRLTTT